MVKILSKNDEQTIHTATKIAESQTSARIVTTVVPASDTYSHYLMLCGFIVGSLLDLLLWHQRILMHFPALLSIQLFFAVLFPLIPGMKRLMLLLLPKQIYHHRAAQLAAEKRLAVTRTISAATPVLLIFISYAERYIHIYPNSIIREKIGDDRWNQIVEKLVRTIPKMKLAPAIAEAIEDSGRILAEYWHR